MIEVEEHVMSIVLEEAKNWIEVDKHLPNIDQRVIVRLCHSKVPFGHKDIIMGGRQIREIYPFEDIKVGRYTPDGWVIDPPHPKYDYSPLSNKEKLKEHVNVTHWSIPGDEELEAWDTRFDRMREYDRLELKVDSEHEEEVFRALVCGASLITKYGGDEFQNINSDVRKYYEILCDLQQCIDSNGKGVNVDGRI